MNRIEANVIIKSPINPDLVTPALRRQISPRPTPVGEVLTHCSVVDKDRTQAEINRTLEEIRAILRQGGIPRKGRGKFMIGLEGAILEAPPAKQPTMISSLRRQFDLDIDHR